MHDDVEPLETELDAMAGEFLGSQYAGSRFADWSIDRRLHAHLLHCGLTNIANDGTTFASLLDRVMANIASAMANGTLRPRHGAS